MKLNLFLNSIILLVVTISMHQLQAAEMDMTACIKITSIKDIPIENSTGVKITMINTCSVPIKAVSCQNFDPARVGAGQVSWVLCEAQIVQPDSEFKSIETSKYYGDKHKYWGCKTTDSDPLCGEAALQKYLEEKNFNLVSAPLFTSKYVAQGGQKKSDTTDKKKLKTSAASRFVQLQRQGNNTYLRNSSDKKLVVNYCSPNPKSSYYLPNAGTHDQDPQGSCKRLSKDSGKGSGTAEIPSGQKHLISTYTDDAKSSFFWGACTVDESSNQIPFVDWNSGGGYRCKY